MSFGLVPSLDQRFGEVETGKLTEHSPTRREERSKLGRLVATRIVGKHSAAKHRCQKFGAVREFRQHGIILQGVRSHGPGPIVILAFRNDHTFPLRQVCKLSSEQLKSIMI